MNDDFSIFWYNDEHAQGLFYDLLARSERHAYDDDFLMQLAAYREAAPTSERADIFAAKYLLHHGDAENAAVCAERAYRRRPVNYEVWLLLAESYAQLDRPVDALTMYGYAYGLYLSPEIPKDLLMRGGTEGLDRLSIAAGIGTGVPTTQTRACLADHALEFQLDAFVGEFLPLTPPAGSARYWVAAYVDNAFLSDQSQLLEEVRHTGVFVDKMQRDYPFCLQKAQEVRGRVTIEVPEGAEVILPIAGTEPLQKLTITTETQPPASAYLGKWAFSQFRLT